MSPVESSRIQVKIDSSSSDSVLEFTMVQQSDSGVYVFVVSNSAGSAEALFTLEVEGNFEMYVCGMC